MKKEKEYKKKKNKQTNKLQWHFLEEEKQLLKHLNMEYFHYLQINILNNQNNQNSQKNQNSQNNSSISLESNNSDTANNTS